MDQEELARESMRVLALLEQRDQEEEEARNSFARLLAPTIPPPPRMPKLELDLDEPFPLTRRTQPPPTPAARSKDVRVKLCDAWVQLTECMEAVSDWQKRAKVDIGLRALHATIRQASALVDDAIAELEPPTDRKSKRPTWRP